MYLDQFARDDIVYLYLGIDATNADVGSSRDRVFSPSTATSRCFVLGKRTRRVSSDCWDEIIGHETHIIVADHCNDLAWIRVAGALREPTNNNLGFRESMEISGKRLG
jgi:hypothetical protein